MDQLDWVIIGVGAFIALVIAVSAYEAEKRLNQIIKLLERWPWGREEAGASPSLRALAPQNPGR